MSDLHRKLAGKSVPSMGLPPKLGSQSSRSRGRGGNNMKKSYQGVSWRKYWHSKNLVKTDSGEFCVYEAGSAEAGLVVCLLHGAGYSGLTWSLLSHHLSQLVTCRILAIDLRGHGETQLNPASASGEMDMSGEAMARDVTEVLTNLLSGENVVLVGHSMGGALASLVAEAGLAGLVGLVVEDVVEGTALEALASMHTVLQNRPRQFQSVEQAVEWCVRSGQVRNLESARVSMPGQVVNSQGVLAAKIIEEVGEGEGSDSDSRPTAARASSVSAESIKEEDEEEEEAEKTFKVPPQPPGPGVDRTPPQTFTGPEVWRWKIDLARTEPHWRGWFQGLSARFLGVAGAKLLLLAGVDRLDRELTVGQMQGKFQMQVLPQVGHTVHEDSPDRVAEVLAGFLVRNKFCPALDNFRPTFPGC